MTQLQTADATNTRSVAQSTSETYVTFFVQNQLFGIPVMQVQDILSPDVIAPVPLSPAEISGSINLRGRIVTVIDVRTRLALPPRDTSEKHRFMGVTVENGGEYYTLLVDGVGDVVNLPAHQREDNPATLDPLWREIAGGIYRMDGALLVTLDVGRLLDIRTKN